MIPDERFVVDLYIRVSTDRQVNQGDSLEEQETELKKFCDYRGFDIHNTLIEKGRSGANTNRPEYQRLIEDVKQKRINAVVVKKLDRLSRSLLDFEQLMMLFRENDVEFISLKESFDTTSAMGKAMLRVALVFAQLEREQTSERLTDVMEFRASKGVYNGGTRPYGYTNINKELIPYPKEREIVEIIFNTFLKYKSTSHVEQILNAKGYRTRSNKPWDRRLIDKILRQPSCIGKLNWNGESYQGLHPPIISEDTFNQVQDIFQERGYTRKKRINALLANILFCTCGIAMKANYTQKKSGKKYFYYRCDTTINSHAVNQPCRKSYLIMDDADRRVIQRIKDYSSRAYLNHLQKEFDDYNAAINQKMAKMEIEIKEIDVQLAEIKQKKTTYLDSLVSQQFSGNERQLINDQIQTFNQEEKTLKAKQGKLTFDLSATQKRLIVSNDLKAILLHFKINADLMTEEDRQDWIQTHISRITFSENEHIEIQFKWLQEHMKKFAESD